LCLRLKTDDLKLSDYIEPIEVVNALGALKKQSASRDIRN
jgi:hypothetical protein